MQSVQYVCDPPDFPSFDVFFFFQAEDGIRDLTVTGVQTCALPISWRGQPSPLTAHYRPLPPFPALSWCASSSAAPWTASTWSCRTASRSTTGNGPASPCRRATRSEEHTSELQSQSNLVCRLLLEKKNIEIL